MDDIALRTEVERLRAENGELRRAVDDAHAGRLTAEVERNHYTERVDLRPREGWAYVGCLTCGHVEDVPMDLIDPTPWCTHGDRVVWRDPHPGTQAGSDPWTRTVLIAVTANG